MIGLAVDRPVATLAAAVAAVAFSGAALLDAPIRPLPEVDGGRLSVAVEWPAASADRMEQRVTGPIEGAAAAVDGVGRVRSVSWPGRSQVVAELDRGASAERARLEWSDRIADVTRDLPREVRPGPVELALPEAWEASDDGPLLVLAVTADPATATGPALDAAAARVAEAVRRVPGVAEARPRDPGRRIVRVRLDPDRLLALGLTRDDVARALAAEPVDLATGAVRDRGRLVPLVLAPSFRDPADLGALTLRAAMPADSARPPAPAVRLNDVGRAAAERAPPLLRLRIDGRPARRIDVDPVPGANAPAVARAATAAARAVALPADSRVVVERDGAEPARAAVRGFGARAAGAAAALALVLAIGLRPRRLASIALASVAFAIVVAAGALPRLGLSLDLLTLAGLATGVGLAADHAVVVLDEINARRARGTPAAVAARAGARTAIVPLLGAAATTLATLAAFLEIQGAARAWAVPFAIAVVATLCASLVAVTTLVPALAALDPRAVRPRDRGRPSRALRVARLGASRPALVLGGAAAGIACAAVLFARAVPREAEWRGLARDRVAARIRTPAGTGVERVDQVARALERGIVGRPGDPPAVTEVGPDLGVLLWTIPAPDPGERTTRALRASLEARAARVGGADVAILSPDHAGSGLTGVRRDRIALVGWDRRRLDRLAGDLTARLANDPAVATIDSDDDGAWEAGGGAVEIELSPRPDALEAARLDAGEIARSAGRWSPGPAGTARVGSEDLPVEIGFDGPSAGRLEPPGGRPAGPDLPLGPLADPLPRATGERIAREDQRFRRVVAWEFRGTDRAADRLLERVEAIPLPTGVSLETGLAEGDAAGRDAATVVPALALLLLGLAVAGLFESVRAPAVALAAIPLGLLGIAPLWAASGVPFGREGGIGLVLAAGVLADHSILVIDRIRALEGAGYAAREAAVLGAADRARPLALTAATTALALAPFAWRGAGGSATLWHALALSGIGAAVAGAALVPLVVPALWMVGRRGPQSRNRDSASATTVPSDAPRAGSDGSSAYA